ncbi:MAG: hypothetical protein ACK417_06105 [Bacteroidia bacterium]
MRFLFFLFFLICGAVAAQESDGLESAELLKKKPSRNPDLEGLVLTYQMDFLRGFPGDPVQYRQLRSGGFSFTIYFNQRFGKSNYSFAAGLGLSSRNYFTNLRRWDLDPNNPNAVWPDSPAVKNKFVFTTYELVPVEFRYSSKPRGKLKSFKASTGINVGYTGSLGSKSVLGSLTQKFKGRDDMLDLDPWRLAIIGRIGYHRLGLSFYYGLNEWFRTNPVNGRPMSVGLTLML